MIAKALHALSRNEAHVVEDMVGVISLFALLVMGCMALPTA